jgi:hypothetical protein
MKTEVGEPALLWAIKGLGMTVGCDEEGKLRRQ